MPTATRRTTTRRTTARTAARTAAPPAPQDEAVALDGEVLDPDVDPAAVAAAATAGQMQPRIYHDDDGDEVADFSRPPTNLKIKFNGDEVYRGVPILPPAALERMATLRAELAERDNIGRLRLMIDIYGLFLLPEDYARLRDRLDNRPGDSVDLLQQMLPALNYAMEKYGMGRPTQPSLPSASGPGNDGTSSTDGAPRKASTRTRSRRTATST